MASRVARAKSYSSAQSVFETLKTGVPQLSQAQFAQILSLPVPSSTVLAKWSAVSTILQQMVHISPEELAKVVDGINTNGSVSQQYTDISHVDTVKVMMGRYANLRDQYSTTDKEKARLYALTYTKLEEMLSWLEYIENK